MSYIPFKILLAKSKWCSMTKAEFIKKAKILGYTNGWIENAINKMNEINDKYGLGYSYEDIAITKAKKAHENISNRFVWKSKDVIIFKPKKV